MKRIAIIGSRLTDVPEATKNWLTWAVQYLVSALPLDTAVVSGDAAGIDSIAASAAAKRGLYLVCCPISHATWTRVGKKAGPIRNGLMLELSHGVVAFWDGASRGTQDMVRQAEAASKLAGIVLPYGREHLDTAVANALSICR